MDNSPKKSASPTSGRAPHAGRACPFFPALNLSLKFTQDGLHTLYVVDILLGFDPLKIEAASGGA